MLDPYMLAILREAKGRGKVRFSDLSVAVRNPRTLSKKLEWLKEKGLIEVESKLYRLSERGERAYQLLEGLRTLLEEEIEVNVEKIPHQTFAPLLARYCRLLHGRYGERLRGVVLFGSVAKGNWNRNSDIDLMVVVEDWDKPVWERTRELLDIRKKLRKTREYVEAIQRGYYPVIQHYPISAKEAMNFHRIYLDASLDGIILYEKDQFMSKIFGRLLTKLQGDGARRIQMPGGGYYWILKPVEAGEVFDV